MVVLVKFRDAFPEKVQLLKLVWSMEMKWSVLWKVGLVVMTLMAHSSATLSPSGINYEG